MLTILLLAANPKDAQPLDLIKESDAIYRVLRQTKFSEQFILRSHLAVQVSDVQDLLLRYQPDIVHFSGHGGDAGEIYLLDHYGNASPVTGRALETLFALYTEHVKCIVLNACYTSTQAEALARHIQCVVGMGKPFSDSAAHKFSEGFYRGLGYGKNVKTAFEMGCADILLHGYEENDTPQILAYLVDPADLFFLSPHGFITKSETQVERTDDGVGTVFAIVEGLTNQDRLFSESIRNQITEFSKLISYLTEEQYRIIEWLRGQRRARISGSAGSGKTLVAVEKAIRLNNAGLRTLILCHNPTLASYIKSLARDSGVEVYDFVGWISSILERSEDSDGEVWSNYIEPLREDLDIAHLYLVDTQHKYDAILVDEGQDFRENWWSVIEDALISQEAGILYIFHDDNQALLPSRSVYPVRGAPYSLSKNCRNAGKIFQIIRHFHSNAPALSPLLEKKGIVHYSVFNEAHEREDTASAIQDALHHVEPQNLVVLTSESPPISQSLLFNLQIEQAPSLSWQIPVERYLKILSKASELARRQQPKIPQLSHSPYPTDADIHAVQLFSQRIMSSLSSSIHEVMGPGDYRWHYTNSGLSLKTKDQKYNLYKLARYFSVEDWPKGLPEPDKYWVKPIRYPTTHNTKEIHLSDIASFKGLEADGVVMFIRSPRDNIEQFLYVGLSRARYYLHLICHPQVDLQQRNFSWYRTMNDSRVD